MGTGRQRAHLQCIINEINRLLEAVRNQLLLIVIEVQHQHLDGLLNQAEITSDALMTITWQPTHPAA